MFLTTLATENKANYTSSNKGVGAGAKSRLPRRTPRSLFCGDSDLSLTIFSFSQDLLSHIARESPPAPPLHLTHFHLSSSSLQLKGVVQKDPVNLQPVVGCAS